MTVGGTGWGENAGTEEVRVLHVDDDPEFLALSAATLERERFEVVTTTEPAEALDRLPDGFDCVVSDYQMGAMDGIEFLRAVRAEFPDLPFLLFTGKGSEEVAGEAISAGVTDYLRKKPGGDRFTLLANRIENTVAQYRAQRRAAESDRRIRQVHDRVSDAVVALDDEWRYTYLNQRARELLVVGEGELLGRTVWEAYPDLVDTAFETAFRDAMETQEPTSVEASYDPAGIWFAARAYPDEDGLSIYFRDVTDRRERERELREERALTESIFAALPDVFYAFDADGRFIRWNDRLEQVTGYDDAEIAAMEPLDFIAAEDREAVADGIETVLEQHHPDTVEAHLRTRDGERIPYEFTGAELRDETGEVLGLVGIGRDVSERTAQQRKLRRQNQRLEEFARVVSHDLRNRLSVATGSLGLVDDGGEHVERAERALARMERLVADVLDLAEQGRVVDDPEAVLAGPILEEAIAGVVADAAAVELQYPSDRRILADPRRLPELVENLVANAVAHGGDGVTIRVTLEGDTLTVEDDGPGIPPERRDAVFEAGHSTDPDGTGFGLAIVEGIAEAHGWSVTVTESDAGGARFAVRGIESPSGDAGSSTTASPTGDADSSTTASPTGDDR